MAVVANDGSTEPFREWKAAVKVFFHSCRIVEWFGFFLILAKLQICGFVVCFPNNNKKLTTTFLISDASAQLKGITDNGKTLIRSEFLCLSS